LTKLKHGEIVPTGERLSERTLGGLPKTIQTPGYDRSAVTPGIVHLGIGAFHRAHQAVFTDDCLADGETDWGIIAASLRSPETRDALEPQDNLYTLAVRSSDSEVLRVIGSISRVLVARENPEALLDALSDPRTRIVTLTITEKGYTANLAAGELQADHPDVLHDLEKLASPRSALGFITEALVRRRKAGVQPFTLLSCDNLPNNGRTLQKVLSQFAALRDADLGRFVTEQVACPSTMVDRIVPATTDDDRTSVAARLGVHDAWPVMTEPFYQWVVEDRFPTGRPGWERSGVEFVDDVVPYEHMKLRLLNGSHSTIAAIGQVAGLETVSDTVAEPVVREFVQRYWAEVIPTLPAKLEPAAYTRRLLARFDNTSLRHRTEQIASDSCQKIPQRILAPLRELRRAGKPTRFITHAVAVWIRSCAGFDEAGRPLRINDPLLQSWPGKPDQRTASAAEVARAFLGFSAVFEDDFARLPGFADELEAALASFNRIGVLPTLRTLLHSA
jgi:fructuronate reductase